MNREKPILMSSPMIRAILAGHKTMTRRVVEKQPPPGHHIAPCFWSDTGWAYWRDGKIKAYDGPPHAGCTCRPTPCRFVEGDLLWVRETWGTNPCYDYLRPSLLTPHSFPRESEDYRATATTKSCVAKWRPSIFMPRWASRITLEITGVRVERVQDITQADAQAEGCGGDYISPASPWAAERGASPYHDERLPIGSHDYKARFSRLWDSINAKRGFGWEKNPWVWVIQFKRYWPPASARFAGRHNDSRLTTSSQSRRAGATGSAISNVSAIRAIHGRTTDER